MTDIEKQHKIDVEALSKQMQRFYAQKKKIKIYHGTTNSTRAVTFGKDTSVDISTFNRIITINTAEKFVLVEPNVPMDRLVERTLRYGLIPPVVPEFPGITVGGAVQGGAEESSSFKYGMVHDCCLEYEIVLGNGDLMTVSPQRNADLFYGAATSYGSLGIMTLVKLRLVSAKGFVQLTYHTVKSFEEAVSLVKQKSSGTVDFIDGIVFSKKNGVIMTGNFADKNNLPISTFHKSTDEWFYLHAHTISKKYDQYEELIPIKDYVFRYDRGAFWMGRYGFKLFKLPFNRLTRFIFHSICDARTLYRLLHATNISQRYFIQDFNIPSKHTSEFLKLVDEKLRIYPLWICPLKPGKKDTLSANCIQTDLVFNIGVWGESCHDFSSLITLNREFERKASKLGGRKMLYAHQYYSLEDFWKVYDLKSYTTLRNKYHAHNTFSTIYEKTNVSEQYKPTVWVGIWHYLKSTFLYKAHDHN